MWILGALLAILLIFLMYKAAREIAVLRSFLAFASISREKMRYRLHCVNDAAQAYEAARRHVVLRAGCPVPDFWCWRAATKDSSLSEVISLGSWCK